MKNPRRQLLAFCLAALISIGVFIVIDAIGEFRRDMAAMDAELLGRVHLLAEHAQLSFRGVDILLSGLATAIRRTHSQALVHDRVLDTSLQHALDYVPQLTALAVIDASGTELIWRGQPSSSELDLNGTDIVRQHADGRVRHIHTTVMERQSERRFIPMSFRIASADGEFQGFVLALVDAGYFHHYHRQLDPDSAWRVGMYLTTVGRILTLSPASSDGPKDIDNLNAIFKHLSDDSYVEPSPIDGSLRITAYQELDNYPIGVSVSVDYGDFVQSFYGRWTRRLVLFLALIVAARLCYKAINRSIYTAEKLREKRVELLQQQNRFERLSLEIIHHIPNGRAALLDLELRYVFADGRAFSQHERLAPARVLGKTIRDVHRPDVADTLERLVEDALAGNESVAEIEIEDGVFYEVTAVPLRDDKECIDRVLLLSQDITSFHRTRQSLEARNQELHEISFTDSLLGISNRRALDAELQREWARAQRQNQPLSILMIDVDHFKIFNDTYGHAAGDECLRQIANAIGEAVFRPGDLVARYGGEEIAVLLPETNEEGALEVAERVHSALARRAIPFPHSPISDRVTLSIGVASVSPEQDEPACSVVQLADTALYRAKQKGRNRTTVSRVAEAAALTEA